jgi:hypothetical protein
VQRHIAVACAVVKRLSTRRLPLEPGRRTYHTLLVVQLATLPNHQVSYRPSHACGLICYGCHNKLPQAGWLKQQKVIPLGNCKSEIKVSASLVSPGAFFLGLQVTTWFLCGHLVFPLCVRPSWVSLPLLIRMPVLLDQEITLVSFCNLNYLFKVSTLKYNHIIRISVWEFRRDTIRLSLWVCTGKT